MKKRYRAQWKRYLAFMLVCMMFFTSVPLDAMAVDNYSVSAAEGGTIRSEETAGQDSVGLELPGGQSEEELIGEEASGEESAKESTEEESTEESTEETADEAAEEGSAENSSEEESTEEETAEDSEEDLSEEDVEPDDLLLGEIGLLSETKAVSTDCFSVSGSINYYDTNIGGEDWHELLRPLEFDFPINLTATYQSGGETFTVTYPTQINASNGNFYLMFTHDGNGQGSFQIVNIPKKIKIGEEEVTVESYQISIDTDSIPYYDSNPISLDMADPGSFLLAMGIQVKTEKMDLTSVVTGTDQEKNATFELNFTNDRTDTELGTKKIDKNVQASVDTPGTPLTVEVPVGLVYTVTQKPITDFNLSPNYSVTHTPKDSTEPTTETQTGAATGTVTVGETVSITSTNANKNLIKGFEVKWIDNNNASRPAVSEDWFKLSYSDDAEATWKEVTDSYSTEIGVDATPSFDVSNAASNQYSFKGLSGADSEGNILSYQIEIDQSKIPENYEAVFVEKEGKLICELREVTTFNATFKWWDTNNVAGYRPDKDTWPLHMYRRVSGGQYEEVTFPEGKDITDYLEGYNETETSYQLTVDGLPKYNDENNEYDYVILQGTITEDGTVTPQALPHYKTYIDNGTGNHGNDVILCHNNGTMTFRELADNEFNVTKEWRDDVSKEERPEATVTLWRYSYATEDPGIDAAYSNGTAARVTYREMKIQDGNPVYTNTLLSYQLGKDTTETITFDHTTIPALPTDFQLPSTDEQGNRYVYFVRETVDSKDYDVTYLTTQSIENDGVSETIDVPVKYGVPNGGTICNTRKEIAEIDIRKEWRYPEAIAEVEKASVQLAIYAPKNSGDGTLYELQVYNQEENGSYTKLESTVSAAQQTVSGFTSQAGFKDALYYVNICDENGQKYDMANAVIKETIKIEGSDDPITITYDAGKGSFTLGENSFVTDTILMETLTDNQPSIYRYQQNNTICGEMDYKIIKKWQGTIEAEEYEQLESVDFKIYRRSSGNPAEGYTQLGGLYSVPYGTGTDWEETFENFDKYDENGFLYEYKAEECSVTIKAGSTLAEGLDDAGRTMSLSAYQSLLRTKNIVATGTSNWSSDFYRTDASTTIVNYRAVEGDLYFRTYKTWVDNGDVGHREQIQIKIYRKADLKAALEQYRDTHAADSETGKSLADLAASFGEDHFVGTAEINRNTDWTTIVNITELQRKWQESHTDYVISDNLEDFIVIESAIGGHAITYSVTDLLAAAAAPTSGYRIEGSVTTDDRQYVSVSERSDDSTSVMFTNTRVGQAELTMNKVWKDEHNANNTRGTVGTTAVVFQVYQNGKPYQNADSNIKLDDAGCSGAIWDATAGQVSVKVTDDNKTLDAWNFKLLNLPLFDASGKQNTYDIVETQSPASYTSTGTPIELEILTDKPDHVKYTDEYTNIVFGNTDHRAYIYWYDEATGGDDRPDIYLTLYRYKKSDGEYPVLEKYEGPEEQKWIAGNNAVEPEHGNYDWKVEIKDLPKYSEDGEEYVYVFQERMNNDGVSAYGTYTQTSETTLRDRIGLYDEFIHTITGYMQVSGDKRWNIASKYKTTNEDLPSPTLVLYRSLTDINIQGLTKEEISAKVTSGELVRVNQTILNDTKKDKFAFPNVTAGTEEEQKAIDEAVEAGLLLKVTEGGTEKYMLPKYDEQGRKYNYLIREDIDNAIADQLYTKVSAGGTLTNTFVEGVNRREIVVKKTWVRNGLSTNADQFPSVTYKLYRYVIDETATDKGASTAILLDSVRISAEAFAAAAKSGTTYQHTFSDLLIYSPSGKQYGYYVVESPINGYEIAYTDEFDLEGSIKEDASDVISLPEDPLTAGTKSVSVGTCNTYNPKDVIKVSGQKYWNDYQQSTLIYGARPDSITVKISRRTDNESGQINKVEWDELTLAATTEEGKVPTVSASGTTYYIYWTKSDTDNYWSYSVAGLEKYAPNGMAYIYRITEEPVSGYRANTQYAQQAGFNSTTNEMTMSNLTNSFDGTYTVRKNWIDGNNQYGLRPSNVTIVLQRKLEDTSDWQYIDWDPAFGTYNAADSKWTGLPGDAEITDGATTKKVVGIKLSGANVVKNTKNNSWEYTFTNLPTQNKEGKKWEYRCIETQIGAAEVDESDGKAGAYTRTYITQDAQKTIVQNNLESTTLYVKKNWAKDLDNRYSTRPEKLTFKLQLRNATLNAGGGYTYGEWETVQVDGKDYIFTISATENWEKTLEDLPVARVNETGDTTYNLFFRAVECTEGTTLQASGAQNYKDITDYSNGSTAHSYNNDASRNESTITNELIVATDIKVNKNWHREDGDTVQANFELFYHIAGETGTDGDIWHCFGDSDDCTTGTATNGCRETHSDTSGCVRKTLSSTKESTETFTWMNLPQFNRDGKELSYKVVEYPVEGYKTEVTATADTTLGYAKEYTFTNHELQDYTVHKTWVNESYAQKAATGFTATFQLQQRVDGSTDWTSVKDAEGKALEVTLTSETANDTTQKHTWEELPKYNLDGKKITYRAVETKINGVDVTNNSNGSYIVTYLYGQNTADQTDSAFKDTQTLATNRMVYGFVNMTKKAAYLNDNAVRADGTKTLKDVTFDIYSVAGETETLYVSSVKTDANGNLICNEDGTYGTAPNNKYLITGSYRLKESASNADYSIWAKGVDFTVGKSGGTTDTGEHGTAWIYTTTTDSSNAAAAQMNLNVIYIHQDAITVHTASDTCKPLLQTAPANDAYNLESRGVITFQKTGDGVALNVHTAASGESKTYFGVYTDAACTNQVAGMMAAEDGKTMKLTTKASDGETDSKAAFTAKVNSADIPYLRVTDSGDCTLLSGTYYLKEIVAPAGYKLDTTVRKAVIAKLNTADIGVSLKTVYTSNIAKVGLTTDTDGATDYQWKNNENQVTIYKRDQYGRKVDLGGNYLELQVGGDKKFLTGENTIRLYQNTAKPAAKSDGSDFTEGAKPQITYDANTQSWTITGLFDINTTYTLSEPAGSVPNANIPAKDITFEMGSDGVITSVTDAAAQTSSEAVLTADGSAYDNYYYAAAAGNEILLRNNARYRKDLVLLKQDTADTPAPIANIYFKLYKYTKNEESTITGKQAVLEDKAYLITDANGKVDFAASTLKNQITGCDLSYGLDIGDYYLEEVERGASDRYRLLAPIYFSVTATTPGASDAGDTHKYAEFELQTHEAVSLSTAGNQLTVTNTPVTESTVAKKLDLLKVDSVTDTTKLSGAKFTLSYSSINKEETAGTGYHVDETINCITGADGYLYVANADGTASDKKPDISKKGSYVLTETQAPDGYMTRTGDGTNTPVTMVTFDVTTDNQITNVVCYDGTGALVAAEITTATSGTEHTGLKVTLKNEKTVVSISKLDDLKALNKTSSQTDLNGQMLSGAELEIYEGTATADASKKVYNWTSNNTVHNVTKGTLKENQIYTLHENTAPVGYLKAKDIYFKIAGTTTVDGKVISQIWVWSGTSAPTALTGTDWVKTQNIDTDNVITMVDEVVIAPVDMRKMVGTASSSEVLPNATFKVEAVNDDGSTYTTLGVAKTNDQGFLVWKSIESAAYAKKLIYTAAGKEAASTDWGSLSGQSIIFKQNKNGYRFTETYAPDHAYNEGKSFIVKISDKNYTDYRDAANKANLFVDIQKTSSSTLSDRTAAEGTGKATDYLNPPFKTTFEMFKYDKEHYEINSTADNYDKIGINGVTFTLSRLGDDGKTYTEVNTYTTAANGSKNGFLSITITQKGTYKLVETTPTGYKENTTPIIFTVVNDDYQKTLTYDSGTTSTNHTKVIKEAAADTYKTGTDGAWYGLANERIHGSIELKKVDKDAELAQLTGVEYTLTKVSDPYNANVDKAEGFHCCTESCSHTSTDVSYNVLKLYTGKKYPLVAGAETIGAIGTAAVDATDADGEACAGTLRIEDLQWGKYKLVETKEISGYKQVTAEYEIEIKPGRLDHVLGETIDGQTVVTNEKNHISLEKYNNATEEADIKPLAGAHFEIHEGASCSSTCKPATFFDDDSEIEEADKVTSVVSGADGKVSIYGLPTDNTSTTPKLYHLVETEAPLGYKIADPVVFSVDRDGKIRIGSDVTVTPLTDSKVEMKDEPIKIYIQKIGEESTTKLSGATFTLADACGTGCRHEQKLADGTDSVTVVTGTDGTVMIPIEKIIGGHRYKLTETKAPEGYECTAVITFTVDVHGQIVTDTTGVNAYVVTGGYNSETVKNGAVDTAKTTITVSNEKIRVKLTKQDYDTNAVLGGVSFEVTPDEGSSFADGVTGPVDGKYTAKTDTSGEIKIPDGLLIHGDTYILTETGLGTNTSYRLADEANNRQIKFKVEENGNLTITSANAFFQFKNDGETKNLTHLVVTNQQIQLGVKKVDQATDASLADVKLKISYYDTTAAAWKPFYIAGKNNADGTWTTTTAENIFQGTNLIPGTYMIEEITGLSETAEHKGYNLLTEKFYFTINAQGQISASGSKFESGAISGSSYAYAFTNPVDGDAEKRAIHLTIKNAAYSDLQITKVGSDNAKLEGVQLRLDVDSDGTWKYVKLNSDGKATVSDNKVTTTETATEAVLTTGSDGIVCFKNLPDGKYRLTELKTAQGYNLMSRQLIIEIKRSEESYLVKDSSGNVITNLALKRVESSDIISMTLVNQKGFALPQTGTTTPKLPWPAIPLAVLVESLVLYLYQKSTKSRIEEEVSAS